LYPDGRPGELFITMAKEGSTVGGLMDAFGTAVSISLQYGVPLEALVNKFSHMRFEPMGHTTNPDVRIAKSLVDYIFRWLGIAFLPGYRESIGLAPRSENPKGPSEKASGEKASGEKSKGISEKAAAANSADTKTVDSVAHKSTAPSAEAGNSPVNGNGAVVAPISNGHAYGNGRAVTMQRDDDGTSVASRNEQFALFQSDAPSCENCGAITVRNGNCYLCHNCGNSMGCS
jgi:ribonucleoside-diphosphate reductase alpha chain